MTAAIVLVYLYLIQEKMFKTSVNVRPPLSFNVFFLENPSTNKPYTARK